MRHFYRCFAFVTIVSASLPARAQEDTRGSRAQPISTQTRARAMHGPEAPSSRFPSHVFQLAAHQPPGVQLSFHYGLLQPILMGGFNAALDIRYRRLVLSYSHGHGLDASKRLSDQERRAGMELRMPWTTGGGIGLVLLDELWILADFKVHRFVAASSAADAEAYTTVTLGAEIGWRYFVWKGLHVGVVARYWPNVYASTGRELKLQTRSGTTLAHEPMQQGYGGLFANVLVGWAFEL